MRLVLVRRVLPAVAAGALLVLGLGLSTPAGAATPLTDCAAPGAALLDCLTGPEDDAEWIDENECDGGGHAACPSPPEAGPDTQSDLDGAGVDGAGDEEAGSARSSRSGFLPDTGGGTTRSLWPVGLAFIGLGSVLVAASSREPAGND